MLILSLAATFLLGRTLVHRLDPDAPRAWTWGAGFLVGVGCAGALCLAASLVGVAWGRWLPVAFGLAALALGVGLRGAPTSRRGGRGELPTLLVLAFPALCLAGYAFDAVAFPIGTWDFWAIWGLKAKFFVAHGGVDWSLLRDPDHAFVNPQYPLLLPLYLGFSSLALGRWDDAALAWVFVAFLLASALLLFGAWVERLGSFRSALAIAIAISPLFLPTLGFADAPLAAFLLAGVTALERYRARGGARLALLAGLLLGLAAWIKLEGLAALAVLVVLATVFWRRLLPAVGIAVAIGASWPLLRWLHHSPSDPRVFALSAFPERIGKIPELVRLVALSPPPAALFWGLVVLALALSLRRLGRPDRLPLAFAALLLAGYVSTYLFSTADWSWHVASSWPRLPAHVLPIVTLVALPPLFEAARESIAARRAPAIVLLAALFIVGFQPRYPRYLAREAAAALGLYSKRPPVLEPARVADADPTYPAFLAEIAARTPDDARIAVDYGAATDSGYEYGFFRATYLLAPRRTVPTRAPYLRSDGTAGFTLRFPDRGEREGALWRGRGGALYPAAGAADLRAR